MKYCESCGTAMSDGARFCPQCGKPAARRKQTDSGDNTYRTEHDRYDDNSQDARRGKNESETEHRDGERQWRRQRNDEERRRDHSTIGSILMGTALGMFIGHMLGWDRHSAAAEAQSQVSLPPAGADRVHDYDHDRFDNDDDRNHYDDHNTYDDDDDWNSDGGDDWSSNDDDDSDNDDWGSDDDSYSGSDGYDDSYDWGGGDWDGSDDDW